MMSESAIQAQAGHSRLISTSPMARPPPLQLASDNLRPEADDTPLPQAKTPSSTLLSRIYGRDWRRIVIAVASINALRFISHISWAYQDFAVDQLYSTPLATATAVTVLLYAATLVIEVFGIVSVTIRSISFIETYVHLTFGSVAMMTITGLIYTLSFFIYSRELIEECTALAMAGRAASKSTFIGDLWPTAKNLTQHDASTQCHTAWSASKWTHIYGIFIFYIIPSVIQLFIVCTFHRQVTDHSHPSGLRRHRVIPPSARIEAGPRSREGLLTSRSSGWSSAQSSGVESSSRRLGVSARPRMVTISESAPSGFSPGPPSFQFADNGQYTQLHDQVLSSAQD